ncbi:hypothetical protein BDZ94DRAFT_793496 [Collybia nuda]|uniref:Uncharacterized protein n=1 Tax=Collybia nuda TaxID=64659 RepID=A0A9P6CDI1_9AGAR|nr:hypothetical protein BDZ94DRAFT_793496 [Collybia nuda]
MVTIDSTQIIDYLWIGQVGLFHYMVATSALISIETRRLSKIMNEALTTMTTLQFCDLRHSNLSAIVASVVHLHCISLRKIVVTCLKKSSHGNVI